MKKKNYKRACIGVLTVALLLSTNINSFVVHGSETADTQPDIEDSAVPIQEGTTTQTEVDVPPQEVPEVQEKETKKDTPTGIVSPMVGNMLKGNLVRATKNAGAFNVTGGTANTDWGYDDVTKILTFNNNGTYTVTGDGQATTNRIVVAANFVGAITINNVKINVSMEYDACAFEIKNTAKLTLMLEGSNELKSNNNKAGLEFGGATTGTLTIDSDTNGSLEARGGTGSAAIGGSLNQPGNNITINGGNINVEGGDAGIGGSTANKITINGGIIAAKCWNGTAIGGADLAKNIIINGGYINATCANFGTAIGSGAMGKVENIEINGGTIIATSDHGTAIGSGSSNYASQTVDVKNIKITGGNIIAKSSYYTAIGSSATGGIVEDIIITGGSITATTGDLNNGSGIGSSRFGTTNNIVIDGGSVNANSISIPPKNSEGQEVYLAKLDNQDGVSSVKVDEIDYKIASNHTDDTSLYLYLSGKNHIIEIENSVNKTKFDVKWDGSKFIIPVKAGAFYVTGGIAGTDWGYNGTTKILTFNNSGTYTVTGDGIETSDRIVVADNFVGTITIKDVNINSICAFEVKNTAKLTLMLEGKNKLKSGNSFAGLTFSDASTGTLTIDSKTNGSLEAIGSNYGAGIGGVVLQKGKKITIQGGIITATGSEKAAGIGGGMNGRGEDITISGGTVTATGGIGGAGIGGGDGGSASNITIDGGSVKANSISIPPKNSAGDTVYLAKLDNQDGVSSVKVDGADYNIAGNHSDSDNSLYLYLSGKNHIIEIENGVNKTKFDVKWDGSKFIIPVKAGAFYVTGGISGTDWGYDDVTKILTFNKSGTYTVTGDGIETQDRIVVADNFVGTITIKDINIKPNSGNYLNPLCAFEVKGTANLTLMLEGKNILQSENGKAGLQFNGINDNTLIINSRTSDGALDAIGGDWAPGIGGTDVSNITINGGNINASGSKGGVGIGGVNNVKNITINGGNINVDGGNDNPGIGGSIVDKITINGGTITAKSSVTAIGCQEFAKNIEINGGVITATSEYNSAIGSGGRSSFHASQTVDVEKIKITGGTINATSQRRVAIGSSIMKGVVEDIIITGGSITAISGQLTWGSGIGNYLEGNTKNIVIDGGSVKTNKFSIPPKNTAGENVYLAKLENQDGVNSLKVDGKDITRNGNHPNDSSFYLYLSGQHHSINSGTNNYGARWNGSDGFRWITRDSYTLTIPATVSPNNSTADISVSNIELLDMNKKLNVKIGNDSSTLDTNGKLTLKRSDNATMKTTVTIGSTPIAPDFQIFSANDSWNGSKTLNFAVADPSSILAGTYRETLTFVASVE